jgi:ferredoxin
MLGLPAREIGATVGTIHALAAKTKWANIAPIFGYGILPEHASYTWKLATEKSLDLGALGTMLLAVAVGALAFAGGPFPIRMQVVQAVAPQMFFGMGQPKGDPVSLEIKTFDGVKTATGVAGGPMMKSMASSGIIYGCKDGQCGTCEVKMDGRSVRPCVAKLPKKAVVKVDITGNTVLKSRKQSNF